MEYGFVIDQRRCIGCHACTVACKSENDVPVGDFRTWVKYVEKGAFPKVRRHFTVLRCNHCDAAPCVDICPTLALHKRPDKIVDLDPALCIGCRSCMQACPYDALYLNEDTGTAEKCHYCAHRTELGLEPACVVVCPEEAIVSGDVSDANSKIATLIREEPTSQRKLEKGTKPRLWYLDALPESLKPGETREPQSWLWSDRRTPPKPLPGFEEPPDLVTTLNVDHPPVWGWHIWSYLFTKNIAAGAMMIAPFLGLLGVAKGWWPEAFGLVFLALTSFLLVHDLGRPERFLKILFHPNVNSWLVKGSWVLMAFGGLTTASLAFRIIGETGPSDILRWLNLPAAVLASGYTAFLFAQCKGRDLWLEPGLFLSLVLRAALIGSILALVWPAAGLLLAGADPPYFPRALGGVACGLALVNAAWLLREIYARPGEAARRAVARFRERYTSNALFIILVLAAIQYFFLPLRTGPDSFFWTTISSLAVLGGMFVYERSWVQAGQEEPIS